MSRRNYYSGKYKLDRAEFLSAKYYALRYNAWKEEYRHLGGLSAVNFDGMPHGSGSGNSTERAGIRRAELGEKIAAIEQAAHETDESLCKYILKGVTETWANYDYLDKVENIPCGRTRYMMLRRKFYYILARKI